MFFTYRFTVWNYLPLCLLEGAVCWSHCLYIIYVCGFRSLLLHLQGWYSDLAWPFDEEETILGMRYVISGILTGTTTFLFTGALENL
jgi:hypothetical protein